MFPLRLSPFEESFLHDDESGCSLDIVLRMELRGVVDRPALEKAFRTALDRHPLMKAQVRRTWTGRYHWVLDDRHPPELIWMDAASETRPFPPTGKVYAAEGVPTRISMWVQSDRTTMVFHCHHTRTDGAGLFQFLGDLFVAYARNLDPRCTADLPPLEPGQLAVRHKFGLNPWRLLRCLPKLAVGLRGIRQFTSRRPAVLTPTREGLLESPQDVATSTRVIDIDAAATASLRAVAKSRNASLNDLLARDLFLAIQSWRQQRGFDKASDWVRLMVPINMRREEDAVMPAANCVSTVYLDRQPHACTDPEALLRSIHDEMQLIKENELGLIFVLSLAAAGIVPGGIRRLTRGQESIATAVFSNLMRPLETWRLPRRDDRIAAGNLIVESLDVYAPLRRNMLLACVALTYADQLRWCLRFDHERLTDEEIESFTGQLRDRVLATACQTQAIR